ncbi:MAG: hypothetical protein IJP21_04370 [Clostridia bacterium]|nr:hypothetical protein [Clostridia bacterium]
MDKKLILKKIITVFTAFILTFALACLGLCVTAKVATKSDFFKGVINKTNYINFAEEEIKEGLSDLAIPSGLPSDFFSDKIKSDTISKIITDSVNHIFLNSSAPDFSFIKENLQKEITLWANENFVFIDDATNSAISLLSEECYHVVLRYTSPDIFQYLGRLASAFSKVAIIGIISSLILCAFTLFFLFKLLSRKEFFFFSFVSFCSGGLLVGIIPFILLITNKIASIAILSKSLYAFVCGFVNSCLVILALFGLLFILISVIFVLLEKKQNK